MFFFLSFPALFLALEIAMWWWKGLLLAQQSYRPRKATCDPRRPEGKLGLPTGGPKRTGKKTCIYIYFNINILWFTSLHRVFKTQNLQKGKLISSKLCEMVPCHFPLHFRECTINYEKITYPHSAGTPPCTPNKPSISIRSTWGTLFHFGDGLQSTSDGLQPKSDVLMFIGHCSSVASNYNSN